MADSYTGTAAVSWDQAAYNKLLLFAFRENNIFDQMANVKPTNVTNPGATVTFFLATDLAPATTALSETTDVDAVALADSTITVSLFEQGNAVIDTQLIRLTSMIPVDPAIANLLGYNAALSMDILAVNALKVGTNVRYSGSVAGRTSIGTGNVLSTADVRFARNRLRRKNVPTRDGYFNAAVHSDTLYDLMGETGGIGWAETHKYTDAQVAVFYTGQAGIYQGFRFTETTNAPLFADASNGSGSTGTIDVYGSLFMGDQALAKGFSNADGYGENPITVKGPVVDKLERFQPWGWKHFVGYRRFREDSLWRVESASSVGAN